MTTGWISLALSFLGDISTADIVTGWVSNDGVATLVDSHGTRDGRVERDASQDYQLIVGYQYQDSTVIRFKRKINTCDGEDITITVRASVYFSLICFGKQYSSQFKIENGRKAKLAQN